MKRFNNRLGFCKVIAKIQHRLFSESETSVRYLHTMFFTVNTQIRSIFWEFATDLHFATNQSQRALNVFVQRLHTCYLQFWRLNVAWFCSECGWWLICSQRLPLVQTDTSDLSVCLALWHFLLQMNHVTNSTPHFHYLQNVSIWRVVKNWSLFVCLSHIC